VNCTSMSQEIWRGHAFAELGNLRHNSLRVIFEGPCWTKVTFLHLDVEI
jgi:hypothetical protein